jgi:predicted nucleic acid-binding Zn ribbon protein
MQLLVVLVLAVVFAFMLMAKENKKPKRTCPSCGGDNTRQMGPTTRVLQGGGYIATAGKSHVCDSCGSMF